MLFVVSEDSSLIRLDKFLATQLTGRARNQIQYDIAAGMVRVDGEISTQTALKMRQGQKVEYTPPSELFHELKPEAIPLNIQYEDDHLIVVDKPAGLVVHPAPGHASGTLVNALLAHCGPSLEGVGGATRWGIVHRLDALTSGLMVAAKTAASYERLVSMLAAREVRRLYLGLALGPFQKNSGTIELPIVRRRSDRTHMGVLDPRRALRWNLTGKPARTDWELLIQSEGVALLALKLHSGRTHQIRVHMQAIGRPILADLEYGWTKARTLHALPPGLRGPLSKVWPARQMLHAARLSFEHPLHESVQLDFKSAPPGDMLRVMDIFWDKSVCAKRISEWLNQD